MELWHPSYELTDSSMVDPDQPISDDPLCDGLVSWWINLPLTRGGTKWFDLCNRNHGTLSGMDPATDWLGPLGRSGGFGSLNLDGVNDRVTLTTALRVNTPFSIAAWFRTTGNNVSIYGCANGIFSAGYIFSVGNISSGTLGMSHASGTGVASSATVNDGTWKHGVVTCDGTTTVYINGIQDGSGSQTFTTPANDPAIGAQAANTNNRWFPGDLDDVALWSRALSSNDVAALYDDSRLAHPRMLNWQRRRIFAAAGGGGGGAIYPDAYVQQNVPAFLRHNRHRESGIIDSIGGALAGDRPIIHLPQYVQSASSSFDTASASIAVALSSNVTAGEFLWLSVYATKAVVSVSDTQGNAWRRITSVFDDTTERFTEIWCANNVAAGATTVTATFSDSSANPRRAILVQVRGVADEDPIDKVSSATGTGTNVSSGSITPATNCQYCIGVVSSPDNDVSITDGKFKVRVQDANFELCASDYSQPNAGSVSHVLEQGASTDWTAIIVSLRSSGYPYPPALGTFEPPPATAFLHDDLPKVAVPY